MKDVERNLEKLEQIERGKRIKNIGYFLYCVGIST